MRRSVWLLAMGLGLAACNKSGDDKTAAKPVDGVVAITADETGFHPDNIALKQGEKATLRFTRTTDETCADKVVFPELKIEKDLPLQQAVDIPIEATEARTLGFQCGMGMFKSKVVIR